MLRRLAVTILILTGSGLVAPRLWAEPTPTSDLLLPYFEVNLSGFKRTTVFTVTNDGDKPVQVKMEVHTNWGILMEEVEVTLDPKETRGFNLRDWVREGELPQPNGTLAALAPQTLAHVQLALSGQQSPQDHMYYATQVLPDLAVGYVTIRAEGANRDDVLWGNFYIIDPDDDSAQGDVLVDIDPAHHCHDLCTRHLLFFLDGGVFDAGTEIVVWNPGQSQPQPSPDAVVQVAGLDTVVRNLEGQVISDDSQGLLATQTVTMGELANLAKSGSMELATTGRGLSQAPVDSFIGIRYGAEHRYSAVLQSWCKPLEVTGGVPDRISIDLEKFTNGEDADQPTGPQINEGSTVNWDYVVTNTGALTLADVTVSDNRGVAVSCPKTVLAPGESMTCTGSGIAELGQYSNLGTVTGVDSQGRIARDQDPSHYFGTSEPPPPPPPPIAVDIEKATNGDDADLPTGPEILTGSPVTWTYVVTNSGAVTLLEVAVTDDQEGAIGCPKTTLAAGETMTCTASGIAGEGQYSNLATVVGRDEINRTATDSDPSHYYGTLLPPPPPPPLSIDIEKATNGQDADAAPGPELTVGEAVTWTYMVTNTGQVTLFDVAVSDDQEGAISCPKTTLAPGESMTCTASGTAQLGQYVNLGTVTGHDDLERPASDADPSHYHASPIPPIGIHIEKATNGHDADQPTGPKIMVGDPVTWTYVVTNAGEVTLSDVAVEDNVEGAVTCPKTMLDPGESMTCTLQGVAVEGQYANVGMVTGHDDIYGRQAADEDPSHYYGEVTEVGEEGCTPGYWKNHTDSWPPTGYSPSQSVASVFAQASAYPALGSASLLDALAFQGGPGVEGGARNLLRAAVASLLDSSHPGVDYPRTPLQVISQVNSALASGDRETMLTLAGDLDADNNLGCPLN